MTQAALNHPDILRPSADDSAIARETAVRLGAYLHDVDHAELKFRSDSTGEELVLPAPLLKLLHGVLVEMGQGNPVVMGPVRDVMTTDAAAEFLNLPESYLLELLDQGIIPSWNVGDRRLMLVGDVQAYWEDWKEKRLAALAELTALSQEMGLGY